jgi:hypothetical protein
MKLFHPIIFVFGTVALLVGCDAKSSMTIPLTTTVASTDKGRWLIEYYVNSNTLSFAVISGPFAKAGEGHVRAGGSTSDGQVWVHLHRPDGSEVAILDTGRIFQVSGTNVVESSQHISARVFKAFLDSQPSDYSVPELLKFAEAYK